MLTRLKVTGFKNLVDVDVHFGPFTCIAGATGVGKSNLFDAIRFLSALADRTFVDAAKSVRDEGGRTGDIRALFHRVGEKVAERMTFDAEMIIPPEGVDDLGQPAVATATFLRYKVELGFRPSRIDSGDPLELLEERLEPISWADSDQPFRFPHGPEWFGTAVQTSKLKSAFIWTEGSAPKRIFQQFEGGAIGLSVGRPASRMPRTVVSAVNAAESPTLLLARREMQSWRALQFEPSALRRPDSFGDSTQLGANGSHLPGMLHRLAANDPAHGPSAFDSVAARLQELIPDIRTVRVDRDEGRELLSLIVTDRHKTPLSARALSDGTLRFLALAALELDPDERGVICFEEPENGLHPSRIPAMLRLLHGIAVDPTLPVAADNPLRQVIVNTHSPVVVSEVAPDDLLVAVTQEAIQDGVRFPRVVFQCLDKTWRSGLSPASHPLALGELAAYLARGWVDDDPPMNGHAVDRVRERADVRELYGPPAD